MANKVLLLKAVEGSRIHTMDIPVSETARAIDVCQNMYEKFIYLRAQGFKDIEAIYGFPILCPTCKALVDVDPKLEGFEKYCPVCEMQARNLITYNQMKNYDQVLSGE
jgi:hypothetical protein